jgi:hypothetical protein
MQGHFQGYFVDKTAFDFCQAAASDFGFENLIT